MTESAAKPNTPGTKPAGFRLQRRDIIALAAIALACAAVFVMVGRLTLPDAGTRYEREIVNDDYDSLTAPLDGENEIRQSIIASGQLYGVIVDIHTYDRVPQGTLQLEVLDAGGARLTGCEIDMATLLDNTFRPLIFDEKLDAGDSTAYTLVFTTTPTTPEDVIALHKSEGPAPDYISPEETADADADGRAPIVFHHLTDFELTEGGEVQRGTLALQYVIKYAGSFITTAYTFFAVVLTVFLLVLYLLLFVIRWPLHQLFLVCCLALGAVFLFLIPPRTGPDEYYHIAQAYRNANALLGVAEPEDPLLMTMRAGDAMQLHNYDFTATDVFAYQELYEGLFERDPGGEPVQVQINGARALPLLHAAPTLGVLAARLLGLGRVPMLLLGRLANLIFFAVLVSRAIKRMPLAKPLLFCIGLLPGCLQLAASFSYDTYVIALSFYITATILQLGLAQDSRPIRPAQLVGLGVAAVLLAPAKAVYVLLLLLLLLIPKARYSGRWVRPVFWGGLALGAAALWLATNSGAVIGNLSNVLNSSAALSLPFISLGGSVPGLLAGVGLQLHNPLYILSHLPQVLDLIFNTFWQQSPLWLQGLLGTRLGEPIAVELEANWLVSVAMVLMLLAAALPDQQDSTVLAKRWRLSFAGVAALVFAALFAIGLLWTPVGYETLFGVQGRYLLPALPLVLLAVRGHNLAYKKPVWRVCAFAMPVLTILTCLQVFQQVVARMSIVPV